ncbi:hypothetical protein SB751_30450, partial [Cupriavidus sp. SIMBA_020]|uniref:hypothetical protein n=1 Tax=Cupriavidus sp. SIMBA_020 TaxID=3085766 RepID=UPI00397A10C8
PARRIVLDAGNNCRPDRSRPLIPRLGAYRPPRHDLAERPMFKGKLPDYHPSVLSNNDETTKQTQ